MKKNIADIWFEKRTIGSLNLSKEMLAGPRFSTKMIRLKALYSVFSTRQKASDDDFILPKCKYPRQIHFILYIKNNDERF